MIIEAILSVFFGLLRGILSFFPTFSTYGEAPQGFLSMLHIGLNFFPSDVFITVLSSFIFWLTVYFIYGGYRFVRRL